MYNTIDFTQSGGLWLTQDTLSFLQNGTSNVLDAMAKLVGNKAVIDGVVVDGAGTSVSDGWISYNGQILPFVGGLKNNHIDIETIAVDEQFDDGTLKPTYTTIRLKMVAIASGTSFPFTDLIYPGTFKDVWVKGDIKEVECDMAYYLANFDNTGLGLNERAGWAVCGTNGTRARAGMVSVMFNPADADMDDFGKTGGAKTHTLSITEMPAHDHEGAVLDNGQTRKTIVDYVTNPYGAGGSIWDKVKKTGGNPTNGGATDPHNNMQPFTVSLFICKL